MQISGSVCTVPTSMLSTEQWLQFLVVLVLSEGFLTHLSVHHYSDVSGFAVFTWLRVVGHPGVNQWLTCLHEMFCWANSGLLLIPYLCIIYLGTQSMFTMMEGSFYWKTNLAHLSTFQYLPSWLSFFLSPCSQWDTGGGVGVSIPQVLSHSLDVWCGVCVHAQMYRQVYSTSMISFAKIRWKSPSCVKCIFYYYLKQLSIAFIANENLSK